jgi:hypothetical protein
MITACSALPEVAAADEEGHPARRGLKTMQESRSPG